MPEDPPGREVSWVWLQTLCFGGALVTRYDGDFALKAGKVGVIDFKGSHIVDNCV